MNGNTTVVIYVKLENFLKYNRNWDVVDETRVRQENLIIICTYLKDNI